MKKILFILFVMFSAFRILMFFPEHKYDRSLISNPIEEKYDESLSHFNSVDHIITYLDNPLHSDSGKYVFALDSLLRHRFYHRCSYYTPRTNIIAYLMGNLVWEHFKAVVIPDEILKFPCAQCSQIAIVFQSILLKKGFRLRTVKLRNHYCTEVRYAGSWHFFDPDFEPIIDKNRPVPSVRELMSHPDLLEEIYNLSEGHKVHLHGVHYHFDTEYLQMEETNKVAARNMRNFHQFTFFVLNYGWIIFGGIWLMLYIKSRKLK